MNIFKTMAVTDVEQATRSIPVIDFSPAFRGHPGGLDAVADQVREASEHVGLFYLAGHGVLNDSGWIGIRLPSSTVPAPMR